MAYGLLLAAESLERSDQAGNVLGVTESKQWPECNPRRGDLFPNVPIMESKKSGCSTIIC
jgi:hypothetical protein